MNQNKKEMKAKLLEMLLNNEITKQQFKKVLKIGLICPIYFVDENIEQNKTPKQKEIESLHFIYEKLGQSIKGIKFNES